MYEEVLLDIARFIRECEEAVRIKLASRQLGEAWIDLHYSTSPHNAAGETTTGETTTR